MVKKLTRDEILAQIPAARAAGRKSQREPWWPIDVRYDHRSRMVVIGLRSGMTMLVPRGEIPELKRATRDQLERVELSGEAIRWPNLDVDVSVPGLISDLLGPRFSTRESGRMGGRSTSKAKAAAARANGAKGGRPRKRRA
ncbi:MAG: DUF2442 domain-containing protein [Gemmatimonadota bacterium]